MGIFDHLTAREQLAVVLIATHIAAAAFGLVIGMAIERLP